jgi:hypothetical protein
VVRGMEVHLASGRGCGSLYLVLWLVVWGLERASGGAAMYFACVRQSAMVLRVSRIIQIMVAGVGVGAFEFGKYSQSLTLLNVFAL